MGSTRNQLRHAAPDGVVHPATRFVTDFTRLITAVDRLMMDIGIATEKEGNAIKTNGDARPLTLNGTISTLREHAHSFVKSLRHFELLFDRIPVPFMELDEKARILRTNEECADMLDGSATPLAGGFPGGAILKMVPVRSPTKRLPWASKAIPVAMPRPSA